MQMWFFPLITEHLKKKAVELNDILFSFKLNLGLLDMHTL